MIRSFRCRETGALNEGFESRQFRGIQSQAQYWLNLQNAYDLETADRAQIEREVLPRDAA